VAKKTSQGGRQLGRGKGDRVKNLDVTKLKRQNPTSSKNSRRENDAERKPAKSQTSTPQRTGNGGI